MSTLQRVFGVGGALVLTAVLGQSQCDVPKVNTGTDGDGGTNGSPDMATPDVVLPGPPTELAISSVNPPSAPQDRPTTVMSIGGTGMQSGATVTIGGVPCTSPVVSPVNFYGTVINCSLAAQAKTCGILPVEVKNPDGKSVTDSKLFFRFPSNALYAARVATVSTGAQPDGIVAADVNGDGKADLVYTQRNANNIAVRLSNGDGTFNATINTYGTGAGPVGLVLADFNGDNKLDAATGNQGSNFSLLLGNGDGTFQGARTVNNGNLAHGVASGDFNGDNKLDLLIANNNVNTVSVSLGDGTGTLAAPTQVTVGSGPAYVATGDFNADGKLDFVSADVNSASASVRLGNGNGTFVVGPTLQTGTTPVGIVVTDVNGDKFADIIVSNQGTSNNLSVFIGSGQGTFAAPINSATGTAPRNFVVTDLNRDGLLDVAVANQGANTVSVLLGDGTGRFAAPMGSNPLVTLAQPFQVVAVDLNNDGNRDLVTTDFNANQLSVFLATEQCK